MQANEDNGLAPGIAARHGGPPGGAERRRTRRLVGAHRGAFDRRPARAAGSCFCWPIKHEPDVRAIVPHWAGFGTQAALPVVVGEDAPLAFRHWAPLPPLAPDRYGIPTPTAGNGWFPI